MSDLVKIVEVSGRAVPVQGDNIDTDIIIPARYLKLVTFDTLGQFPFQDQRFDREGKATDHPFNQPQYQGANVLIVNKNFGCGSSREHAPQALMRWGIKAIVGEGYAAIFEGNCRTLGMPAVKVPESVVLTLQDHVRSNPQTEFKLDLESKGLTYQVGAATQHIPFEMPETSRKALMEGSWDSTNMLLASKEDIERVAQRLPYVRQLAAARR
jgi:3-isopropylmalate/(R)-2-methylmalate dehydratase small subunit